MKKLLFLSLSLCFVTVLTAQDLEEMMHGLSWRAIGPANMGGRVTDIVGIPGDPSTFYVAGADGGVFKTINGGTSFDALFTKQRVYSVGALAVSASDQNVVWLGSGEGDPRNSVGYGNGVYRSIDGGQSWDHLGLDKTERIKRIVVHPNDPDIACVCALGREWGPNAERGVFRTVDGGKTWEHVLKIDHDTGCSDLAMDLSNPRIMYAGMWTFRRKPWRFDGGGKETALYRSKDSGTTWEKIHKGLPEGPMSRIGVAVAQSQPNTVYLISEFKEGGTFFRSDVRGNSWKKVNDDPNVNFRPFYYSDIRVDPTNPDIIYSLSGRLMKSRDGGKNFETIARNVHGDHQSFWIDPTNPKRLLSGSDGGYQVSLDEGASWDIINNVELSQFYQLDIDMLNPYNVYGGLQDNGCWRGPSNSLNTAGIMKRHWKRLSYGDGYYAVPIPGSEHEIYTNLQGGVPFHVNSETGVVRSIHPHPVITGSAGDAIENHKYRFNWDSPIHISPHDPNTVFFGGNVLFRSRDRGHSWEELSDDLTTNDKSKQRTSGGEIYQDNTAAEFHCSALTIAESPIEEGVIWVGTDDGNLQITRDGGEHWTNVNTKVGGLPEFAWVAKIHASEHEAGTAFVAVDQHRSDDFRPYAFVTTDYGMTWKKITDGLPKDDYVKVIRQDPIKSNVLYIGMEHGVYMSWDMGGSWTRINNNLPPVSVRDLRIHPREHDLIVGTHGRGVWILDDIRALVYHEDAQSDGVHIFSARDATRWNPYQQIESLGTRVYRADNPEYGAYINFKLTEDPTEDVVIHIKDEAGNLVREIKDSTIKAGLNRIVWDLRGEGPSALDHPAAGGWRSGDYRPKLPPGKYTASLKVDEVEKTTEIQVSPDPRLELTVDDYLEQYETANSLVILLSKTNELINNYDHLSAQLDALKLNAKTMEEVEQEDLMQKITALQDQLKEERAQLTRPPPSMSYRQKPRLREEILSLIYAVDGPEAKPTLSQSDRRVSLQTETNEAAQRLNRIVVEELPKINTLMGTIPRIGVKLNIKP